MKRWDIILGEHISPWHYFTECEMSNRMGTRAFLAFLLTVAISSPVLAGAPTLRPVAHAENTLAIGAAPRGVWIVMPCKGSNIWHWKDARPKRVRVKLPRWLLSIDRIQERGKGSVIFGQDPEGDVIVATLRGGKIRKLPAPFNRAVSVWMAGKKPFAAVAIAPGEKAKQVWGPTKPLELPKQKEAVSGINPAIGNFCRHMIPTCDGANVAEKRLAVCLTGCSRMEPALLAIWEGDFKKAVHIPLGKKLHPDAVVLQGDHARVLAKHDDLGTYSDFLLFEIDLTTRKVTPKPKLPVKAMEVQIAGVARDGSLWAQVVIKQGEKLPSTLWRYKKKWEQIPLRTPDGDALELWNFAIDSQGEVWASASQPGDSDRNWILTTSLTPAAGISLSAEN